MNELIGFTLPYTENGVTKQFPFYYIKDAQGNICYIVDKFGKLVVSYNYDAWGNVVSKFFFKYGVANAKTNYSITLGTTVYTAQDIDNLNSHYYRGYYYDKETGFYYLTTRYYDPKTDRFISSDDPKYLDFEVAYGHNRYAYCLNNPVMYVDPEGNSITVALLIIGAIVGVAVGVGIAAYNDYQDDAEVNGSIGWYNYLGSAILGGIIGAGIGAGIGAIAGTSFTVTIPTIGSMITGGGTAAATTAATITVSGEAVAGFGLAFLGGYVLSKHEPGMKSGAPVSWTNRNEGVEAMIKFNGDANKAADYIMNNHKDIWNYGAGSERNKIHKWLDRAIRKLLKRH